MKPIFLSLQGFHGIRSGIGKDHISINMANLPSGLIAVVGENGMGKTTILDNLHPYRIMPYKLRDSKSGWTTGAFTYYDECYSRDAHKIFRFEVNGAIYESKILIDAEKRKMEAYLFEYQGLEGPQQGLAEDHDAWKALNDGKTKTYDEALEKVCGSPSLFFTGPFRAQDARKLSGYSRSEIMGVIAELLNIDQIKVQGDKAKQVADALSIRASSLFDIKNEIKEKLEQAEVSRKLLEEKRQELKGTEDAIRDLDGEIFEIEKQIAEAGRADEKKAELEATLAAKKSEYATNQENLRKASANIARINDEYQEAEKQALDSYLEASNKASDNMRKIGERFSKDSARIEATINDREQKLARANKILSGADLINENLAKETDLLRQIAEAEETLPTVKAALQDKKAELAELQKIDQKHAITLSQIENYNHQADLLNHIDCYSDGSGRINEGCQLLASAVKARESAAKLAEQLLDLELAKALQGNVPFEVETMEKSIAETETLIKDCREQMVECQRFTKLKAELDLAGEQAESLATEIEAAKQELETAKADLGREHDELVAEKSALAKQLEEKRRKLEAARDERLEEAVIVEETISGIMKKQHEAIFSLEIDLDKLNQVDMKALAQQKENAMTRRETMRVGIGSTQQHIGVLQKDVDTIAQLDRDLLAASVDHENVTKQIADWRILQKACSNDGIIALEIDDAGPTISAIANDLLSSCYGSRFTVRMETQSEKRDGSMKEDFDITVFDADRDQEKSITKMSGGEVTWIEDAITRAICLYHLQRSDLSYQTLFSDEKDGALDPNRKGEFFAIKRRAMELGKHDQEFFISQTPELVELADARIVLHPGSVSVC